MYEYLRKDFGFLIGADILDDYGRRFWELVSIQPYDNGYGITIYAYYFKRKL